MTDGRYRFASRFDAAVYLVTAPLQFVWIVLLFLTVRSSGWAALAVFALLAATVAINGIMFRRAGREAGTRYTALNGVGTAAGRACLRAAWVRLRSDDPKVTPVP